MYHRYVSIAVSLSLLLAAPQVSADPYVMVPPIYTGPGQPITRVGLQETYVFYKDGIETFVIRPGYEGKVDEFGMLIPFPKPPALRKMPDHIFSHVAAAVDPPEVVVNLQLELLRNRAVSQDILDFSARVLNTTSPALTSFEGFRPTRKSWACAHNNSQATRLCRDRSRHNVPSVNRIGENQANPARTRAENSRRS